MTETNPCKILESTSNEEKENHILSDKESHQHIVAEIQKGKIQPKIKLQVDCSFRSFAYKSARKRNLSPSCISNFEKYLKEEHHLYVFVGKYHDYVKEVCNYLQHDDDDDDQENINCHIYKCNPTANSKDAIAVVHFIPGTEQGKIQINAYRRFFFFFFFFQIICLSKECGWGH